MSSNQFEAVIGIEIHAQIATKTKMFCGCSTDSFEAEPNINTCPVCMGYPGQLPVINKDCVRWGAVAALALNCEVPSFSKFDRKNYFYPDLPKGFQISQFDQPLAINGWVEIDNLDKKKKIRITRLHLEDDAGKLTHVPNGTLCDYNRSGVPLMEIVSEPDLRSAEEAGAYARAMQTILRYTGASEADMEKGMMRFDASVSIRPVGDQKLYARAEIKNLNSFRSLEAAVSYEINRQIGLFENDRALDKDVTVGWSDDERKTYFLRDKEGADDYRYFPEPDLPPLIITPEFIDELQQQVPELPNSRKERYLNTYGLTENDASLLASDRMLAECFEDVSRNTGDAKMTASLMTTNLLSLLKKNGMDFKDSNVTAQHMIELVKLVNDSKISFNQAKGEVFNEVFESGKMPLEVVKEKGLEKVSDERAIESICIKVLDNNANVVEDFKNGKQQAFGYLIGQVMKESKGQADPKIVNEILNKLINP